MTRKMWGPGRGPSVLGLAGGGLAQTAAENTEEAQDAIDRMRGETTTQSPGTQDFGIGGAGMTGVGEGDGGTGARSLRDAGAGDGRIRGTGVFGPPGTTPGQCRRPGRLQGRRRPGRLRERRRPGRLRDADAWDDSGYSDARDDSRDRRRGNERRRGNDWNRHRDSRNGRGNDRDSRTGAGTTGTGGTDAVTPGTGAGMTGTGCGNSGTGNPQRPEPAAREARGRLQPAARQRPEPAEREARNAQHWRGDGDRRVGVRRRNLLPGAPPTSTSGSPQCNGKLIRLKRRTRPTGSSIRAGYGRSGAAAKPTAERATPARSERAPATDESIAIVNVILDGEVESVGKGRARAARRGWLLHEPRRERQDQRPERRPTDRSRGSRKGR